MYRFLIYISYPYSIPIGKPLQQEILSRNHEVYWFSDLESTKAHLSKDEPLLNSVKEVLDYSPHIVLTATDYVADFFPGIKVQIFHGFLANKHIQKHAHFRIRGFFDLYTTQGPSTTKPFEILAEKYGSFEVQETGWPKVDPLFPIENKEKTTIPTILIASTFTTKLSLAKNELVFQEIKRLSESNNYRFLCVLHPKLPQEIKDKFSSLQNKNFSYFNTTDLTSLFKEADVMFADTTSAIIEFLLQKKPVVTFNNTKPDKHLINVTEIFQIEPAIQHALEYPNDVIEAIEHFIQETHPYFDGKSSSRVIDAAIHFLKKDKSHLKKKPLNLIRKWKVRRLLNYFTLRSYNKAMTFKLPNEN